MKLVEYVESYNDAPLDITEFAEGAAEVENCVSLASAAEEYISALDHFKDMLEKYHITIG